MGRVSPQRRAGGGNGGGGGVGDWGALRLFQSVSALVDKFKKNDQVFDLNAEVEDSDCEDFPNGPLEDDFDANDEAEQTAAGDRTELGSWKEPCQVQSCQ